MQFLDSKLIVERLNDRIRSEAASLVDMGIEPQLAVVMVGNDPASAKFVKMKTERAKVLGITMSLYHLEEGTSAKEIEEVLKYLAADDAIHGIIIQLPLPAPLKAHTDAFIKLIPDVKDVDGLRGTWEADLQKNVPRTQQDFATEQPHFLAPMVPAVIGLLEEYKVDLSTGPIVIVGKGRLVGGPLQAYLTAAGFAVTAVDEETDGILSIAQKADILITGVGEKDLVTYQWIKEGAVVVDCAGDVHHDSVEQVVSAVTPVIGGVGPLTTSWLLYNLIQAAKK